MTISNKPSDPSDNVPSAPSSGLMLFNCEDQSDLIFKVGLDICDTWRIPAHSFIVESASPTLETIIQHHKATFPPREGNPIPEIFVYCQPEVFHSMLSFIYKNEATLTSVTSTLNLIPVADQFMLQELIQSCLRYLNAKVNATNVLEILSSMKKITQGLQSEHVQDAYNKMGIHHHPGKQLSKDIVVVLIEELYKKCYWTLDQNGEDIIKDSSLMDQLDQSLLNEILNRDTLRVGSETNVFNAIVSWADNQCLKHHHPLTPESKRLVLGDAIYSPRYLCMTQQEFMSNGMSSDTLNEEEKKFVMSKLNGSLELSPPKGMVGRKLDVPRKRAVHPTALERSPIHPLKRMNDTTDLVPRPKKKTASKKILNGIGEFMICVIQLLD